MPRPEGLCDLMKILTIRVTRENKKVHAKTSIRCLLTLQNNSGFTDNKMKRVPVKFIVKINDGISCSPRNEHCR